MLDNACEWGASTFLIFSENVGALVYYTHIFPLLISLFLGIQILFHNPRARVNRVLFFMTTMFGLWVYFDLILWASPTPEAVVFFWSIIVPVEMLIYLSALYLVYLFSTGEKDAPLRTKIGLSLFMVPIILFAHTSLYVVGLAPDCDIGAIEGPLIQYLYLAEIVIIFIAGWFVVRGYKTLKTKESKKKLLFIGLATIAFLLFFSAGNMTLLFSLGPFYEQYKLFGMPVFAVLVTYTIIRYHAFEVKALLTDILVTALWILLFSILLLEDMSTARLIIVITLIAFAFLGFMLSRSVRKEIEQRKEIENLAQKLKEANKHLRELDRLKSEFVSIASHQLKSPLTSVRGYAKMILDGAYGSISAPLKEAVSHINESSRYMSLSVEDFLNVSRIEAGEMKYQMNTFNVRSMVQEVVEGLRPIVEQKSLELRLDLDCKHRCMVHADIGKIHQVLHNLIDNAMKYTQKGSITVKLSDDAKKKKVYISITDTGVGIAKNEMRQIFGKFMRLKNARNAKISGSGLGLYVARQMIEKMGGRITASSKGRGKGSTFTIALPFADK